MDLREVIRGLRGFALGLALGAALALVTRARDRPQGRSAGGAIVADAS
jgi:hypothetical protein